MFSTKFFIWIIVCACLCSFIRTTFVYRSSLNSFTYHKINVDFTPLITSKLNCSLIITASSIQSQNTKTVLTQSCDTLQQNKKQYSLFNLELSKIEYELTLNFDSNLTTYYQMYSSQLYFTVQSMSKSQFVNAVLMKNQVSNIILPFNLLSQKQLAVFVNQNNLQRLVNQNITEQTFLSTYWNEIQSSAIVTPWLPYFSRCQLTAQRIFLYDLLKPEECQSEQTIFGTVQYSCQEQFKSFNCILEQLSLTNPSNEFWWEKSEEILYYLQDQSEQLEEAKNYFHSTSLRNSLLQNKYKHLVPVMYYLSYKAGQQPNHFTLNFKIKMYENSQMDIVSASITATFDNEIQANNDSLVKIDVKIQYIDLFTSLNMFNSSFYFYILISVFYLPFLALAHILLRQTRFGFTILDKIKLILFPIIKGYLFFLLSGGVIIFSYYLICFYTYFQFIPVTFDNDNSNVDSTSTIYYGRNGLMIVICGFFILNISINQSFKICSNDEINILLQQDVDTQMHDQSAQALQEKRNFIIRNLYSHRKYLLLHSLLSVGILLFCYYQFSQFDTIQMVLIFMFAYPFLEKMLIIIYRHFFIQEFLYLYFLIVVYESFFSLFLFMSKSLLDFIGLYLAKIFGQIFFQLFLEFLFEFCQIWLYKNKEKNFITKTVWENIGSKARQIAEESQYQKGLFYSGILISKIASSYLKPLFMLLIYLTLEQSNIYTDMLFSSQSAISVAVLSICLIPLQNWIIFMVIRIISKIFGLNITECIKFNNFKFQRRKVKWMNDVFSHNINIKHFYRQFQKFSYSSQLYIICFLASFSQLVIFLGLKIIFETNYVIYTDPVLVPFFAIVGISVTIFSFIASFISIKLRLYEKKEDGKMRSKLQNIEKILKKRDFSQYLNLDAIKNHFLLFNKEWIVENLTKILTQSDFQENNYELLSKYKFYKSVAKKINLQIKKAAYEKEREQKQRQSTKLFKINGNQVVTIPIKNFNKVGRPLFYSWFYIAKQNLYLKSIIEEVRNQKIKPLCEFCNIDIELQVIEKRQFMDLVNQFRVMNVGKPFHEDIFRKFYSHHQDFLTVCIECKDKKYHLQKKTIKNTKSIASKLILKWLLITRSKMLHQSNTKN